MSAMYVEDITNRTNQAASISLSASHTKTSITPFQKVLEKENALYAAASEENTKSVSLKKTTAKTTEKTSSASKVRHMVWFFILIPPRRALVKYVQL